MENTPLSLDTLAVRVKALENAASQNSENHGKIYARLEAVEKGQGIISSELTSIRDLCNEIKADVKDLKERPMKKYDSISMAILQWLILAVLGAALVLK